jgi:hypothetical protein
MFTEFLQKNDLRGLFAPADTRLPIPPATRRKAWEGLPKALREEILTAANDQRQEPYPTLSATQFLAYVRTGDRTIYETPFFKRRRMLLFAMLAECIEYNGDYLDQVVDGLWCICEESFWGVSAHNGSSHPGSRPAGEHPLPDIDNPYIDLFAAQTSSLLLWTCYLLWEKLDEVTPILRRRVIHEAERRILQPFFHHDDFWWMGMIRKDVNNWTPWILSNVMASLLLVPMEDSRLAEGMARALRMLDSYLDVIPADGGCDEGVSYWNMAGGSLLDCLEHLYSLTGGKVSFYDDPLIQNIGSFPLHAHIAGPWYWNFADCDARPMLDGERVFRYGLRTNNKALAALGAQIASFEKSLLPKDTPETFRVLCKLFQPVAAAPSVQTQMGDFTCVLPDLQVWSAMKNGLYVAMKGGHNGESHNHNDVGSFLVYLDGEPQIVDAGNMTYTAKTFGPERYTLWNTRSMNHNVPLIGEFEQDAGIKHAARNVTFGEDGMSLDLAAAYPKKAGILSLKRETKLQKEKLLLTDSVELKSKHDVTWVFLFRHRPQLESGLAQADEIELRFSPELDVKCREIPIADRRMAKSFPGSLFRLSLTQPDTALTSQTFEIARRPKE